MSLSKNSKIIVAALIVVAVVAAVAVMAEMPSGKGSKTQQNDQGGDDQGSEGQQAQDGAAIVKIIEVESNPAGTDAGHEWVRLKNSGSASVDLSGWTLSSSAGQSGSYSLSGSLGAGQSKTITFPSQFLDNQGEVVVLHDSSGHEVDRTPAITDTKNDGWTWTR